MALNLLRFKGTHSITDVVGAVSCDVELLLRLVWWHRQGGSTAGISLKLSISPVSAGVSLLGDYATQALIAPEPERISGRADAALALQGALRARLGGPPARCAAAGVKRL
jgi:hypothetical protein